MNSRQSDLLQGLATEEASALLALGMPLTLHEGAVLFRLGAESDHLFVVERGRVNLTLPMKFAGREEDILVEERNPGQMLGWSALIPPHRFTLNATVPLETTLIAFPREGLLDHLAARPAVGHLVLRNLATVIGQRLQVLQAMWLREVQRMVERRYA